MDSDLVSRTDDPRRDYDYDYDGATSIAGPSSAHPTIMTLATTPAPSQLPSAIEIIPPSLSSSSSKNRPSTTSDPPILFHPRPQPSTSTIPPRSATPATSIPYIYRRRSSSTSISRPGMTPTTPNTNPIPYVPPSILVNSRSLPNPNPHSLIAPRASSSNYPDSRSVLPPDMMDGPRRREPMGRSGAPIININTGVGMNGGGGAEGIRRERSSSGSTIVPASTSRQRGQERDGNTGGEGRSRRDRDEITRTRRSRPSEPALPLTPTAQTPTQTQARTRRVVSAPTTTHARTRVTTSSTRRRRLQREALDRTLLQTTIALVFVAVVVVSVFDRHAFRDWLQGDDLGLGSGAEMYGYEAGEGVRDDDWGFVLNPRQTASESRRVEGTSGATAYGDEEEGVEEGMLRMPRTPVPVARAPLHPSPPPPTAGDSPTPVSNANSSSSGLQLFDPLLIWEYYFPSSSSPPNYEYDTQAQAQPPQRAMRVPRAREMLGPQRVERSEVGGKRVERLHDWDGSRFGAGFRYDWEEGESVWERIVGRSGGM